MKSIFWSTHRGLVLCCAALCVLASAFYVCFFPIQAAISRQTAADYSSGLTSGLGDKQVLKVYMYDLPRKFNFGLFDRSGPDQDLPWTDFGRIPTPHRSGLRKQHSVEYWMTVNLVSSSTNTEEESPRNIAIRVADPNEADVFFVPFFAALSFNSFGVSMRDPESEVDKKYQAEIIEFLRNSPWWQRSKGLDHVLVLHHPNSFRVHRDQLNASILVVADFGRLSQRVARLSKDVVAPYSHMVHTFVNDDSDRPFEDRTTLLFFQGRIKRKADGIVRTELADILENHPRVHFEEAVATNNTVQQAMEGMRLSRFCLHPAGDTPSSCRLFDAIVSHCVPVIVSDKIELPYEDELDYSEFCLFLSSREATKPGYLVKLLEDFPKDKWMRMWRRLKQVSKHFEYQNPAQPDDAVNMIWKQILKKVPAIKLALHRNKRLKIRDWWNCK